MYLEDLYHFKWWHCLYILYMRVLLLTSHCFITNYHKFSGLKKHNHYLQFCNRSPKLVSQPKSRCSQDCVPSGSSGAKSIFLPFLASRVPVPFLGSWSPAGNCITLTFVSTLQLNLPHSYASLSPLWLHWAHLDNSGYSPHLSILDFIGSGKSLSPYKVTYSENPEIRMWTSLGPIILPNIVS
jgi:hypothetical protein